MSGKSRYQGKKHKPVPYQKKIERLLKAGFLQRGKAYTVDVAHEQWCPRPHGGPCHCDADIHFTPADIAE